MFKPSTHPRKDLLAAALTALLAAGCASNSAMHTSSPMTEPAPESGAEDTTAWLATSRVGLTQKASTLLGENVRAKNQVAIGKLRNLEVDLDSGVVVAGLVGPKNGDELTPVPARSFGVASKGVIVVSTDPKTFKAAPQVKLPATSAIDTTRLEPSFKFFGQPLPRLGGSSGVTLSGCANLLGASVAGENGQVLGTVEDVMLDVPFGRVSCVILKPADAAASQASLYPVPPMSLKIGANGSLQIKTDAPRFLAGPHFQKQFWAEASRSELMLATRDYYGLPTPRMNAAGAQPASARLPAANSTDQPGLRPADSEVTRLVTTEMVRNLGNTLPGGVKVATVNGRVTITGQAKNAQLKQDIGAAAEKIAGQGNVDNQIVVKE